MLTFNEKKILIYLDFMSVDNSTSGNHLRSKLSRFQPKIHTVVCNQAMHVEYDIPFMC